MEYARTLIRSATSRVGLSLKRGRNTLAGARDELLSGKVDLVVGVGAHAGEYGSELRRRPASHD